MLESSTGIPISSPVAFAGANRHDLYLDFIGKLTGGSECFSDICFQFPWEECMDAHRFFLAARCSALGRPPVIVKFIYSAPQQGSVSKCLPMKQEYFLKVTIVVHEL